MAFQGDLSNINLASVFQNLLHNRQTGTLLLRRGREERYVYFREGVITMYSQGPGKGTPLAEFMLRLGIVGEKDLEAARKKKRGRARLSQVISKMGLASPEEIRNAVEEFVREEIYDLFTWEDGTFEFREGDPPEGVFDSEVALADLSIDANEVILEAARRIDEWERINRYLGSSRDVYVVRKEREEELERLREDPVVKTVLSLLDGRRSVEQVVADSRLGRFQVSRVLADLIAGRFLRQLSVSELYAEARRAQGEGRLEEAMGLLERALEIEHGNTDAHLLLAALKERTGHPEEAASAYKVAAGLFLEDSDVERAVEALRNAARIQPHDLAARERLYRLLRDAGRRREAREVLLETASYCLRMGLVERARGLLEDALSFAAEDEEVLKLLAEVYVDAGETAKAAELYRRRAEAALEATEYRRALAWYEEILKVRPGDEEARRRIVEITSGAMERRRRRRRVLFRTAALALVLAVVLVLLLRELVARRASERRDRAVVEAILGGKPALARKILLRFAADHPYTRPAAEAMSMRRMLDAFQAASLLREAEEAERAGDLRRAAGIYRIIKTMDLPADFLNRVDGKLRALPAGE